ncbi:MAG: 50S ribosomal protein L23 [Candidatus Micrarchaeota archaeon]
MTIIINALTTEKAVAGIERENKITFVVDGKATKADVKTEVERLYGEKVVKVNVLVSSHGVKKAMVKFKREGAASDLAARLKVI